MLSDAFLKNNVKISKYNRSCKFMHKYCHYVGIYLCIFAFNKDLSSLYLIGQKFVGQNCRNFGLLSEILSVENFVQCFNTKVRQKLDKSVEISAWCRKFCPTKYFVHRKFSQTKFCPIRYHHVFPFGITESDLVML